MSLPSLPVHNRNKTDDITSRWGYSMIKYGCFLVVALILLCILFVTGLSIISGRNEAAFKRLESNIQKMMESFHGQIGSSPSQPGSDDESNTTIPNSKEKYGWHDPTCKGLGQCRRQGFEKPPLVILSFDGFSREYLDRHIMKSLEKMAECGATAESSATCPTPPTRHYCESGWTLFEGANQCYKLGFNTDFWTAESNCNRMGAHLVSIHGIEENTFVNQFSMCGKMDNTIYGHVLIGMYKQNNMWVWTDGTPTDYYYWSPGEPNNSGGVEGCTETWADNSSDAGVQGHWNDLPCGATVRAYVCKKPSST